MTTDSLPLSQKSFKHNSFKQNNYALYQNTRIIQKHLIYVIGLTAKLSDKTILGSNEYFGQYGKITKIVLNNTKGYITKGVTGPTYSAYIAYSTPFEACIAILATDNFSIGGSVIRTSFGTTKYCTYFLKGYDCPNPNCLFIHHFVNKDETINKDDLVFDKNVFIHQQVLAMRIAEIFKQEVTNQIMNFKVIPNSALPHPSEIYKRDITLLQLEEEIKRQDEKILKEEDEDYFGDEIEQKIHKKKKEEKYAKFAERQCSELSSCSKITTFASFASFERKEAKKHTSFTKRERSRFSFVVEESTEEELQIPETISTIVNSSLAYFKEFKRFIESQFGNFSLD